MGGPMPSPLMRNRHQVAGAVSALPAEDVAASSGDSGVSVSTRPEGVTTPIQTKRFRGDDSGDSGVNSKLPKKAKSLKLAGVTSTRSTRYAPRAALPAGCSDIYGQPGGKLYAYRPLLATRDEPAGLASLAQNTEQPGHRLELYAMPLHLAEEKLRSCVEAVLHKAWDTDHMSKRTISNLLGLQLNQIRLRSGRQTSRCETMGATNKEGRWLIWEEAVMSGSPAEAAFVSLATTGTYTNRADVERLPMQGDVPLGRANGVAPPGASLGDDLPSGVRFGYRGPVVGALLLRKSPRKKEKPGGIVIDYVAADHHNGGRGYPLLCGAESICRSQGYQTLHSAADLSREGRTVFANDEDLLPVVRVPSALEAHLRWGFKEITAPEWKATGLELYDKTSHVTYMKQQVSPP